MSSTYRLICLSHDPGIELGTEWQSGAGGRNTAIGALLTRTGSDEITAHARCDMVIGCYSYPLGEVGYVANGEHVEWIGVQWVTALAIALDASPGLRLPSGWTVERVQRLRPHLGLPAPRAAS